jgi:hypothetical protein
MPALLVGMPVRRAICRFRAVMPRARFHEKLTPGIFGVLIGDGVNSRFYRGGDFVTSLNLDK